MNANSTLTFGVKALGDPVLPKHHIHPLAVATHKQSHLGRGGLTSCPRHLTETTRDSSYLRFLEANNYHNSTLGSAANHAAPASGGRGQRGWRPP